MAALRGGAGGRARNVFWNVVWGAVLVTIAAGVVTAFALGLDPVARAATRPWCPSGTTAVASAKVPVSAAPEGWTYELSCITPAGPHPIGTFKPMLTVFTVTAAALASVLVILYAVLPAIARRRVDTPPLA